MREKCWTALGLNDPALKRSFDEWADPEIIIVERIGADKLAYVREQYWFHLEFQLNLLISFGAIFVALVVSGFINGSFDLARGIERIVAAIVVFGFLCRGLLLAARKNYERHMAKMASLMIALLSQPETKS